MVASSAPFSSSSTTSLSATALAGLFDPAAGWSRFPHRLNHLVRCSAVFESFRTSSLAARSTPFFSMFAMTRHLIRPELDQAGGAGLFHSTASPRTIAQREVMRKHETTSDTNAKPGERRMRLPFCALSNQACDVDGPSK